MSYEAQSLLTLLGLILGSAALFVIGIALWMRVSLKDEQ